jgi:DNA-binding SARP family transcriptional activator
LRQALLEAGRGDVIRTRSPGYLIQVAPEEVDVLVFESHCAAGRRAAEEGRHAEAAQRFRAALGLWRGPALGGTGGRLVTGEAVRLEEMRLAATEDRVAEDLALARHEELVSELTALVTDHPTRERLRGHLMVALCRSGRQSDALAVYRVGRRVLVEELGIEPGPALRAVHEAILRGDRDVLTPPAGRVTVSNDVTTTPSQVVPAQLPSVPTDFIGRDAQVAELIARLSPRPGRGRCADVCHLGAGRYRQVHPGGEGRAGTRGGLPGRAALCPAHVVARGGSPARPSYRTP